MVTAKTDKKNISFLYVLGYSNHDRRNNTSTVTGINNKTT